MKPNPQPQPQVPGARPFAQQKINPRGLITCEAIETYHAARTALDEFCERTDADRKRFNDEHNTARSNVFAFVNENMIHEATVFEVELESFAPGESGFVYYLVEPRNTEIKRVDFVTQQQQQQQQ
jgi:hypothetical protein